MLGRFTQKISDNPVRGGIVIALAVAALFTALLLLRSVMEYSQPGPPIRQDNLRSYGWYIAYAMGRLAFWAFVLSALMAGMGVLVYGSLVSLLGWRFRWYWALIAAGTGFTAITAYAFLYQLLYLPGSIAAAFNYRISRLYPIWEKLSPDMLSTLAWGLGLVITVPVALCALKLTRRGNLPRAGGLAITIAGASALVGFATEHPDAVPKSGLGSTDPSRPNILMIGSDSLRADRLGILGYSRKLTPNIDSLARKGTVFTQAYVPLGRTGPSLASLLTGVWPHTHGYRDNFISDEEKTLRVASLPKALREAGYASGAVGDWASGDLGKIDFGFDQVDLPGDQWNAKYLMRQGPKDMRLFLVLFTHNRLGKALLPELYYLAGVPLTEEVGRDGRRLLQQIASSGKPFFLNAFIASTHGPFGSAYPYYHMYANPKYRGESLFSLTRSSSAEEVVTQQGKDKRDFDVQQMIDLYDGATKSFDDEVARFMAFLEKSGLAGNTIVIVYSDHGFDLFEQETWGQGNVLSDEAHRVPLMIFDPRNLGKGRVIQQVVRSVDLMPTLLEMLQQPVPATVEGESFAHVLRDATMNSRPAFAETGLWISPNVKGLPENRIRYPSILEALDVRNKETGTLSIKPPIEDEIIRAKSRMIRTDQWKLVYFPLKEGASYQLYDVQKDPHMTTDVSAQHPQVVATLKEQLIAWMRQDTRREWRNEQLIGKHVASTLAVKP
jgi:arylsulfatase A-like enzyme